MAYSQKCMCTGRKERETQKYKNNDSVHLFSAQMIIIEWFNFSCLMKTFVVSAIAYFSAVSMRTISSISFWYKKHIFDGFGVYEHFLFLKPFSIIEKRRWTALELHRVGAPITKERWTKMIFKSNFYLEFIRPLLYRDNGRFNSMEKIAATKRPHWERKKIMKASEL